MTTRVRLAPSPTGYFHVGTARTALYNWLFARQTGGTFVLRIEDTDRARNKAEHTEGILRALRWLGLDWDEGPYFQSERGDLYAAAIDRLVAGGKVYACDCTPEQIQARAKERGGPPGYDGHCRDRGLEPGPGRMLRFRTPDEGLITFEELIKDGSTFEAKAIEDFGVRKSNGDPLFLLANVVDDADMAISHVIRGDDHHTNTAKYVLLWDALDYGPRPVFAHMPLLVNEARKKLSKRRDKVAVEDYRDEGFLPEAVINYLALLGWAPSGDRELLTRAELVDEFRLEDVRSASAFFDLRKMSAINAEYLRALPPEEFLTRAQGWLLARWAPIGELIQQRARTLGEVYAMADFLFLPTPTLDAAAWAKAARKPNVAAILDGVIERFATLDPWDPEGVKAILSDVAEACEVKVRDVDAPVRLAVTGRTVGPPLFESVAQLGHDRTLERLRAARARLDGDGA